MDFTLVYRRRPGPAWYATWRRRLAWSRFFRGAAVRWATDVPIPPVLADDPQALAHAEGLARERAAAQFAGWPGAMITFEGGAARPELAAAGTLIWRFHFRVRQRRVGF
jgi:hypothetical protein